jgi:sugar phosphate permease
MDAQLFCDNGSADGSKSIAKFAAASAGGEWARAADVASNIGGCTTARAAKRGELMETGAATFAFFAPAVAGSPVRITVCFVNGMGSAEYRAADSAQPAAS